MVEIAMEILVRMSSIVVCLSVSSAVLFLLSSSSVQGLRYGPPRRFFNGTDQSSDLGSGKAFKNGMVSAHIKERRVQESDGEGGGCESCRGKERDCGGCNGRDGSPGNGGRGGRGGKGGGRGGGKGNGKGERDGSGGNEECNDHKRKKRDNGNDDNVGVSIGIGIGVGGGPSNGPSVTAVLEMAQDVDGAVDMVGEAEEDEDGDGEGTQECGVPEIAVVVGFP
ncbi:hypothetical protein HID58_054696, partial [Brassica napus]